MFRLGNCLSVVALNLLLSFGNSAALSAEPLPSWNDTASKRAIVDFVQGVSTKDSPNYVPPAERIAVFDNDGTLWAEKPLYFQFLFAIDRVKTLAPEHPEWREQQLFKAVLEDDRDALAAAGKAGLLKLLMAAHAGITTEEFSEIARRWQDAARHPSLDRSYTELVYQPMLDLLEYLRDNGFKTYIVSGGGVDFLRVFAEEVYGIPPEQVIGSSIEIEYEVRDGLPLLARLPEVDFIDDKEGKPVAIHRHIGRRPIFAAGNSDGDYEMLKWTTSGDGPRFGLFVHHDDDSREWAYDRDSIVGKLDRGLDDANAHGWRLISMKNDWKLIYREQ